MSITELPPEKAASTAPTGDEVEHRDVLIVGAGLSGIGAAAQLRREMTGTTFALLEAREAIGGTWDLFRYPGIRSDSDMFTLGYRFKPWEDAKAIADGPSILEYVHETAREYGIDKEIRFNSKVVAAEWSSDDARWTVRIEHADTGRSSSMTCGFLYVCSGYYRYEEGYTPEFEGIERFRGEVVHPQHWPEDLDYAGKRVVVIGSGATAVTLVPAMAPEAEHVTMLQRSPTYVISMPGTDPIADRLRRILPSRVVYPLLRWKNVLLQLAFFKLSRRRPQLIRGLLRRGLIKLAPPGLDVDTHFNPRYDPWDQRICLVPDGDLVRGAAQRQGRDRHRHDRALRRDRHRARLRRTPRRRHRRSRPPGSTCRPLAASNSRSTARRSSSPSGRLQGNDALRSPEHGDDARLHERLVDAQGRPRRRVRLPPAQADARGRLRAAPRRNGPIRRIPRSRSWT